MSASDVRRGPGWWMDLEGGWNPPEEWPETTPPLPGWVRNGDGSWRPPTDSNGAVREASQSEVEADTRLSGGEQPARQATAQQPGHRSPLRFAESNHHHRGPRDHFAEVERTRRALSAAALAAITASMIAGGMVLLLLLL